MERTSRVYRVFGTEEQLDRFHWLLSHMMELEEGQLPHWQLTEPWPRPPGSIQTPGERFLCMDHSACKGSTEPHREQYDARHYPLARRNLGDV